MNLFRRQDWAASGTFPPAVVAPYLLGTSVLSGDELAARPVAPPHAHPEVMLVWCYRGTVNVFLEDSVHRLGPGQGLWVPAHAPHSARHERETVGCYTYIPESALAAAVRDVVQVRVPRAVQEMLLHLGTNDMAPGLRVKAQEVLIEMLRVPSVVESDRWGEVPVPADERVRPLVEQVLAHPGARESTAALLHAHGLHERTVLRVFTTEVGLSFQQWRTGVRMGFAARLIADGVPIGVVAHRCGFTTASGFSAAFKGRFGHTPREHVAHVQSDSDQHAYWR